MMHLEVEMFTNDRIFIEIMHFAFCIFKWTCLSIIMECCLHHMAID